MIFLTAKYAECNAEVAKFYMVDLVPVSIL